MPPKPFNPPRPSSKSGPSKPRGRPKASTSKSITKDKVPAPKKSRITKPSTPQHEDEESDDPFASQPIVKSKPTSKTSSTFKASTSNNNGDPGSSDSEIEVRSSPPAPNKVPHIQEEEDDEETDERTKIPDDLLSKIMHELFTEPNSRISKEANKAVGKYMDTFVREAVARVRGFGEDGAAVAVGFLRDHFVGRGLYLEGEKTWGNGNPALIAKSNSPIRLHRAPSTGSRYNIYARLYISETFLVSSSQNFQPILKVKQSFHMPFVSPIKCSQINVHIISVV
ncbi:hypothetical protein EYC80_000658 [Monilinia laxa]|uniref:Uncharacterized protein n=1 Tax=Monilinia laxa TaxID=61186 RepID=A0A5N6KBD9_MONLA|nr:hypothetical protein EYC80_000658 [Monilinia laxa]